LGLELTIYNPALDSDRTRAARLAALLEYVLASDEINTEPECATSRAARITSGPPL
jgi:hypothetical protein